eukprot:4079869-Alexandrium_andersonii.AAC.1
MMHAWTGLPWTTTASAHLEPFDPRPDAPLQAPPMKGHGLTPARPRHEEPLQDARDDKLGEHTGA